MSIFIDYQCFISYFSGMNWTDKIQVSNEDCMETMARYEDNYFDLAVVDPPYGINADIKNNTNKKQSKKSAANSKKYGSQKWDDKIPNADYFKELKRVSKKQLIWGANYFGLKGGMLYWHKNVTMPTYSSGELAWLSWLNKLDFVDITWHGMLQYNMKNKEARIHPTQKPIALYQWIYQNYAKEGYKILDTHFGSGSNGIAIDSVNKIEKLNLSLVACEIDKDYYLSAKKRFEEKTAWSSLFV